MPALGTDGTAGAISATSTPATVTVACPAGTCLQVENDSTSAASIKFNIDGVHGNTDTISVSPGSVRHYVPRVANPVVTYSTTSSTATGQISIAALPYGYGN